LSLQSDTPEDDFHDALNSRRETQIDLVNPIPVHLVYHTVWITPNGRSNYRMDTYQRDRKIFSALQKVGVELIPARS
jgi:murein L,D-transpeptidase YcbB/YkuD